MSIHGLDISINRQKQRKLEAIDTLTDGLEIYNRMIASIKGRIMPTGGQNHVEMRKFLNLISFDRWGSSHGNLIMNLRI